MPLEAVVGIQRSPWSSLQVQQVALAHTCCQSFLGVNPLPGYAEALVRRQQENHPRVQGESPMLIPRRVKEGGVVRWDAPYVRHGLLLGPRPATALGHEPTTRVRLPPHGSWDSDKPVEVRGLIGSRLLFFALRRLRDANARSRRGEEQLVHEAKSAIQAFFVLLLVETHEQADALLDRHDPHRSITTLRADDDMELRIIRWKDCLLDDKVQEFAYNALVHHAGDDGPLDEVDFNNFRAWIQNNLVPPSQGGIIPEAEPGSMPWHLADRAVNWLEAFCLFPNLETREERSDPARPKRTKLHRRMLRAFKHVGTIFRTPLPRRS